MRRVVVGILVLVVLGGCAISGRDEPDPAIRETVLALLRNIEHDNREEIANLLDFRSLLLHQDSDYALKTDSARFFNDSEEMLDDLTGEGFTRKRWMAMKTVVGKATQYRSDEENGVDSASVIVTFVSEVKKYQTTFGLHNANGLWQIYSFHID